MKKWEIVFATLFSLILAEIAIMLPVIIYLRAQGVCL